MRSLSDPLMGSCGKEIYLVGYKVCQIRFCTGGPAVRFLLSGLYDQVHELNFDGEITLWQGEEAQILRGAQPGVTFASQELAPLMVLLGKTVEAVELPPRKGEIRIVFTGGWELTAGADDHDYPVWHLNENVSKL